MCYQKLSNPLLIIAVVLLSLAGCSSPAATPVPSTTTPVPSTAIPPTPTPPELLTSAETLIGNWEPLKKGRDATFLQINSDGTCGQSFLLETLDDFPQVECTYKFEGTNFLLTAVKLNGVPECPSPTGKYEIQLISNDQIELFVAEDTCGPRVRSTLGVYQRIP